MTPTSRTPRTPDRSLQDPAARLPRTRLARLTGLAACAGLVAAGAPALAQGSTPTASLSSLATSVVSAPARATVPASYVVTLAPSGSLTALQPALRALDGQVLHVYEHALRGFAVRLPAALAGASGLAALSVLPGVATVEADQVVRASADQANPPSYGLDRIDQRALPLNQRYSYATTGAGVTAYVIDTGITLGHQEFTGRVTSGFDAVDGGPAEDCEGHGTHVAGTLGGTTYGVAKQVSLVAVRVLNCSGSGATSGVIAGVDWVTGHHAAGTPAVANMSLGGGTSSALDTAVRASIADGIVYSLAAGNSGGTIGEITGAANACNSSPGRVAEGLTVGATDAQDRRASYSNRGTCLDLFAPGSNIVSATDGSPTATTTLSGTSMAAPHVAGVAALVLQRTPGATPAQVNAAIVTGATAGVVGSPGSGSPNRLLFSGV